MKKFLKRLDFKLYISAILPLIVLILTYPAMKWLPARYAYENGLLENLQLIVLLIAFIMCIKTKIDKKFFNSIALVIVILFLREINCGRAVFFPVEGVEDVFYSWKDIKYGYLVEPIYALFIFSSGMYFLLTQSYKVLFKYIKSAKIAIYNWMFLIAGIILGVIGEKIDSLVMEETTELAFYLSLMGIIYLQGFNKSYIEASQD